MGLRTVEDEAEPGGHVPDRTELAGGCDFGGLADQRMDAHPDRLHQEPAVRIGQIDQFGRFGGADGQRLLHQYRLAGRQAGPRRGKMIVVDRRDVHDIDRLVGGQLVGRPVRAGEAVPVGEILGALDAPRAHRNELGFVGEQREIGGERRRDPSGAQHAPADAVFVGTSHA